MSSEARIRRISAIDRFENENRDKSTSTMAQKQPKGPNQSFEVLVKCMGDVTASLASVQSAVDDLKSTVLKRLDDMEVVRADDQSILLARIATVGNQVSYFRQTVCESMKDNVSILGRPS